MNEQVVNTSDPLCNDVEPETNRAHKADPMGPPLAQSDPKRSTRAPAKRKLRWRLLKIAIAILLIGAVGLALRMWWHRIPRPMQSAGTSIQGATISVGAAIISAGDVQVTVNELGTVTPLATINVQTQISGRVTEVAFVEGQFVKEGDPLVQIDPRPYEALKAQFEGQLARDQALLEQAKFNLVRYKTLVATNAIARQTYEDQGFLVQQYEAAVKVDKAQIDQQALNIEYCHLVSPIAGTVGLRAVDSGNYLQTITNTTIAVITQLQPISVIFTIPEDEVPKVLPQIRSGKTLQVTAYDRTNLRKLSVGKVTALDSQLDTTTGTVKLRAQFDNKDEQLFPNQFVNIKLLVNERPGVIRVPISAIQHSNPGSYVYLINTDNKVSVRKIKVGVIDGDMAEVESGLEVGDRVVVDGADQLREGSKVAISAEPEHSSRDRSVGGPALD